MLDEADKILEEAGFKKIYWNYRVCRNSEGFSIREVHYKEGIPHLYSATHLTLATYDFEDLKWKLEEMQKALEKPVLDLDNFPNEWKE